MFFSKDISYHIISLGCSKNQVDSEKINNDMFSAGFINAESTENADIIIINTCGFITPAKEESIEIIFDAIGIKENRIEQNNVKPFDGNGVKKFGTKLVVVGCLTQRYGEEINEDISEIDLIYGIPAEQFIKDLSTKFNISIYENTKRYQKPLIDDLSYSYIKIIEGCSNNCSYCSIPGIRGPSSSFSVDSILFDAEIAAKNGAKELIIVGQDILSYKWKDYNLSYLVNRISEIENIEWIRLLYCHPDHLTDSIIDFIKINNKVVKYIDIPFQHISEHILSSMGRSGSYKKYSELINKLRTVIPEIKIRSTFMVGYPGETEEDFNELISFLEEFKLDRVGAFVYSPEEGTNAYMLEDSVTGKVKNERYEKLMLIQKEISMAKLQSMIGTEIDVLVEEKIDENTYIGRTQFDAPEVDGIFYLTGKNIELNKIVRSKITDSIEYDLIGEIN